MKFRDIPGHQRVKDALRGIADSGNIPHAVMLSGPSGIGKMIMARTLVQYVHCLSPEDGEPCGRCLSCKQHSSFNHPDIHFIYPIVKSEAKKILTSSDQIEAWKRMLADYPAMPPEKWPELLEAGNSQPLIYVNDAEEIVRKESYPPFSSDFKFYIIWLPERLQPGAANKLLKVIEEPSPGTVFLLVSNEEEKVLPTILSRTQRFHMQPLSEEEISNYLSGKFGLSTGESRELARLAGGRLSKADELGGHSGETGEFESVFRNLMRAAYARKPSELRTISEKTSAYGREKLIRFLNYMARMTRENFIFNLKYPELNAMTSSEADFSRKFSPFINHTNVEDLMREIDRTIKDVSRNANAKLVMFDFFLLIIGLLHRKQ